MKSEKTIDVKDYEKLVYLSEPEYDAATNALFWKERSWNNNRYETIKYCLKENQISSDTKDVLMNLFKRAGETVTEYLFSCDKTRIAYVCAQEKEREAVPPLWKAPIVGEGGSYRRESDGGWKIDRIYRLSVYDTVSQKSDMIYESTEALHLLCWNEDSTKLVFEDVKKGNTYHLADLSKETDRIICLSGEAHAVLGDAGACCLPDGEIILTAGLHGTEEIFGYDLFALRADGSGAISLSHEGDIPDEVFPQIINGSPFHEKKHEICLTDRTDTAAVIGSRKGEIAIYLITLTMTEEKHARILWKQLTNGTGSYSTLCKGEEGSLYAVRSDWNHPAQLVKVDLTDGSYQTVRDANEWIGKRAFAKTTNFKCSTLDGADTLDGWILEPSDRTQDKIPTVLLIHGGPLSAYADSFTLEAQLLAAAGMGVLLVNPRGSSGYGKAYASYEKAFDGTAANDLLYYMDCALRAHPWMDETRLGVAGGSYGGYMSAWLAGHCKRFKAAVVMRGLLNFEFLCLTSQAAGNPGMYDSPKDFEDFLMRMTEDSPTTYAQEMDIPMLIMHGEKDVNTPLDGAHQLYVAVKDTHPDLPVRFIIFPGVGHNIRAARIDYYERYELELVNWLKKYL